MKTLELHFCFLRDALNANTQEDFDKVCKSYGVIKNLYRTIRKREEIVLFTLAEVFESTVETLLQEADFATNTFLEEKDDGSYDVIIDPDSLEYVKIITAKLEAFMEYLPSSVSFQPDEIFAYEKTHDIWKKLHEASETVVLAEKHILDNQWNKIYGIIEIANATSYKSLQLDTSKTRGQLLTALHIFYYKAKAVEARRHASLLVANAKMEHAFRVWNFSEKPLMKEIGKLSLVSIGYDRKIYVDRLFPIIDRETILREYEDGTLDKLTPMAWTPEDLHSKKEKVLQTLFVKNLEKVKIRIIAPFPLVIEGGKGEKTSAYLKEKMNNVKRLFRPEKPKHTPETDGVIIQIHGGGFVSGSSASHRVYLYKWAKETNRIIFSSTLR